MKNKLTKLICVWVMLIMSIGVLCACDKEISADSFTDEQHLQRVTELAQKRYIYENSIYTDMKVYPLYNADEELEYFLIDLEPYGYVYVKINQVSGRYGIGMYTQSDGFPWQRLRFWDSDEPYPISGWQKRTSKDKYVYEINENGEFVEYKDSHFKVADMSADKKYLIEINVPNNSGYIPAVKRGNKFLNLVSMEEFDLSDLENNKSIPIGRVYFPPKNSANL